MSTAFLVLTIVLTIAGALCFAVTTATKNTFADLVGICLLIAAGMFGAVYGAVVSL